jgi:hypothetical protein
MILLLMCIALTMESQLAAMMDLIKKSEQRHNQQLIKHGIHIKSHLSQVFPSKAPVNSTTPSRGTHIPSTTPHSVPQPGHSSLQPDPLNPTVDRKRPSS